MATEPPRRAPGFGRVDVTRPVAFSWNGISLRGAEGDTLASALMANGVAATGRSVAYGRLRGLGCAGPSASGGLALVAMKDAPATLHDPALVELREGLSAALPPKPTGRRPLAAETRPTSDEDAITDYCEALVIGAGPAGLEAARLLAEAGRDVLLVDRDFVVGGGALYEPTPIDETPPLAWLENRRAALARGGVRLRLRTALVGRFADGALALREATAPQIDGRATRLWRVRFDVCVLATGGLEGRGVFQNNDLPGVVTASALRAALFRFGVAPGRRILIATANDTGYLKVDDLVAAGGAPTILDMRPPASARRASGVSGVGHRGGVAPLRAVGRGALSAVELARRRRGAAAGERWRETTERLRADTLAIAGGWRPDPLAEAIAAAAPDRIHRAGSAAGATTPAACAVSGRNAARRALGAAEDDLERETAAEPGAHAAPIFPATSRGGRAFVDIARDRLHGDDAEATPPDISAPDRIEDLFQPAPTARRSPAHAALAGLGCSFETSEGWLRATRRRLAGETDADATRREARAARETVALADLSALGKILATGPNAAEALDRALTRSPLRMADGRARPALALADDGAVIAETVIWRFSGDALWLTATTPGAERLRSRIDTLLQTRWPDLKAALTVVDDAYAGFALMGPRARRALGRVAPDLPLDDDALSQGGVRLWRVGPALCRIARLAPAGEVGYEIFTPARYGEALFQLLWEATRELDGALCGAAAQDVLRVERGRLGPNEIDGRATLADLGRPHAPDADRAFAGSALAASPGQSAIDRPRLVSVAATAETARLAPGAALMRETGGGLRLGWLSSVAFSPVAGVDLALGYLESGAEHWEDRVLRAENPDGARAQVRIGPPGDFNPISPAAIAAADAVEAPPPRPAPTSLPARAALGGLVNDPTARRAHQAAEARLEECGPISFLRFVAWPGAFPAAEAALVSSLNLRAPPTPGVSVLGALGVRVARIAPLEWLIVADEPSIAARVRGAPLDLGRLEDCSDGVAQLRLVGATARPALARVIDVDMRPAQFGPQAAAMIGLGGAPTLLARTAADAYALWVRRSAAAAVWEHLAAALDRAGADDLG